MEPGAAVLQAAVLLQHKLAWVPDCMPADYPITLVYEDKDAFSQEGAHMIGGWVGGWGRLTAVAQQLAIGGGDGGGAPRCGHLFAL